MLISPDFINDSHLRKSPIRVIVIGAGGTGSLLVSKLMLMHNALNCLEHAGFDLTLIDHDVVSPSNIGGQTFYPFDIGQNKAKTLIERMNNFGNMNWSWQGEMYTQSNHTGLFNNAVIFGCVDNIKARKDIHAQFKKSYNCIWIDTGNDKNSSQIICGLNAQINSESTYIPSSMDLFAEQIETIVEKPSDSCGSEEAFLKQDYGINDITANYATQILWRLIRHGQCAYHGLMIDIESGVTQPITPNPDTWAMFGYAPNQPTITPHAA